MNRTVSRRLWTQSPLAVISESGPVHRLSFRCLRRFSNSKKANEVDHSKPISLLDPELSRSATLQDHASPSLRPKVSTNTSTMDALSKLMETNHQDRKAREGSKSGIDIDKVTSDGYLVDYRQERREEPHHIHVYATRHNTHITITRPDYSPLLSKSAGNIGFRHSQRKHYDSAFQLAAYVFEKLHETGKSRDITKLAVILRGFGAGREAVTKALLGSEGRYLRGKIVSVSDATRLKFGGTRSKKPRRLG